MLNMKSKRTVVGLAACAAVVALTIAGLAVSSTAGAGTDTTRRKTPTPAPTATATAIAAAPPLAPAEPPAAAAVDGNTGDRAGASTLPSTGYGDAGNRTATMFFLLAGVILAVGSALTIAGRMPRSRKQ